MSWNGFDALDLSTIEGSTAMLGAGKYIVNVGDAKVEQVGQTTNRRLTIVLTDTQGGGDLRVGFNIHHTSAKAQEIALSQLKSFLISAAHPSPDRPGDITSLNNLTVGVIIGYGKPYLNNKGEKRQSVEAKRFFPVADFDKFTTPTETPADLSSLSSAGSAQRSGGGAHKDMDDEIPF